MTVKKINKYIYEASRVVDSIKTHSDKILKISKLLINTHRKNKTIYVCGNGGSDSEAEHFVTELLCTYNKKDRKPISAISLNSSASSISAWSNDFQYETFLKRSVQAHCKKDDVLFILTTSGGSKNSKQSINVVNAAKEAKKKSVKVVVLTGKKGGEILKYSDLYIHIKSDKTSHIQESQLIILHLICEFLEN
jgi:D-sedoheptulose 7-phosphate isomerase|tara:strand:+ start:547 stop:1125 length:579 start_codon:yes stop_codon:yes gene_type:complete